MIVTLRADCHESFVLLKLFKAFRPWLFAIVSERNLFENIVWPAGEHVVQHRQIFDQRRELLISPSVEHLDRLKGC